ncbi:MAG: hypothetical protein WCK67_12645 [bacterium]
MYSKKFIGLSLITAAVLASSSPAFAELTSLDDLQSLPNANQSFLVDSGKPLDKNHWAYKTLENISKKHGLLVGSTKDKFDINKPLSRDEAAVLLISLVGKIQQDRVELSEAEKVQLDILRQELNGEMARLTGRVDALQNSVAQLNGTVQSLQASDKQSVKMEFGENFKIKGSFQVRYANSFNKGVENYANGFRLPLGEVRLQGKLHKDINYLASIVPSRTFDSTTNSILGDAYVMTEKLKHHKIYLGQTRTPIGYEGTLSPTSLNTPDRSQIARNFSDTRDFGIKAVGNYKLLDYYLGAYNGNGNNRNDTHNSDLAYGYWVVGKPLAYMPKLGVFEIGGGMFSGKYSQFTNNVFTKDIYQTTKGLYTSYEFKRNKITSEWSDKKGYSNVVGRKATGWYIEDALFLNKKRTHQVVLKYDTFDPNKNVSDDRSTEYTLGYNYYMKAQNLKLQLDYVHANNKVGNDSNRVIVQTQYCF